MDLDRNPSALCPPRREALEEPLEDARPLLPAALSPASKGGPTVVDSNTPPSAAGRTPGRQSLVCAGLVFALLLILRCWSLAPFDPCPPSGAERTDCGVCQPRYFPQRRFLQLQRLAQSSWFLLERNLVFSWHVENLLPASRLPCPPPLETRDLESAAPAAALPLSALPLPSGERQVARERMPQSSFPASQFRHPRPVHLAWWWPVHCDHGGGWRPVECRMPPPAAAAWRRTPPASCAAELLHQGVEPKTTEPEFALPPEFELPPAASYASAAHPWSRAAAHGLTRQK
eukprot:scaffold109_cov252-Pinguiococcus_pyrenoidosus.AAC.34